jgi:hypothetical protein
MKLSPKLALKDFTVAVAVSMSSNAAWMQAVSLARAMRLGNFDRRLEILTLGSAVILNSRY